MELRPGIGLGPLEDVGLDDHRLLHSFAWGQSAKCASAYRTPSRSSIVATLSGSALPLSVLIKTIAAPHDRHVVGVAFGGSSYSPRRAPKRSRCASMLL